MSEWPSKHNGPCACRFIRAEEFGEVKQIEWCGLHSIQHNEIDRLNALLLNIENIVEQNIKQYPMVQSLYNTVFPLKNNSQSHDLLKNYFKYEKIEVNREINDSREYRLSLGGFSVKSGWGINEKIIIKYPFTLCPLNMMAYQEWLKDVAKICNEHNASLKN